MNIPTKTFAIKSPEIEIDKENPFEHCKLNRLKYAKILTKLVSSDSEGFVLALNNRWGEGKTTFIRMWTEYLKKEDIATVMFNAWENDFVSSPLTALIAEMKSLEPRGGKEFAKVLNAASKITKGIAPALLKAVANKYLETEVLKDLINESIDALSKDFKKEVAEYEKQKKSIDSFKETLAKFVAGNSNGKPVVFIIDELDRCRPNYAVSILESIKHLFSVPNVIFVLSIDKLQLEKAICGVYGSDNMDAVEYLRKFIDIEYSLPKPKPTEYFEFLYVNYDFDSFFKSQPSDFGFGRNSDKQHFNQISKMIVGSISLRNQEKIMSHLRISLMLHSDTRETFHPILYVFLVYCKHMERDFYEKLVSQKFQLKGAQEAFYEITSIFDSSFESTLSILEAYFIISYNYSKYKENTLFTIDLEGKVVTNYLPRSNSDTFNRYIKLIDSGTNIYSLKMGKLIEKINLIDDFNLE